MIAYVPLGLALYASNLAFPSSQDSNAVVLAGNAYLVAALMAAGRWPGTPGRGSPRRSSRAWRRAWFLPYGRGW